jgi:hypothetical protein
MSREDDFRIRPGRIRSRGVQRAKPFVAQALAAALKAGGQVSRSGRIGAPRASRFGRGRIASDRRLLRATASRPSRRGSFGTMLARLEAHLSYLRREGVTRRRRRACSAW